MSLEAPRKGRYLTIRLGREPRETVSAIRPCASRGPSAALLGIFVSTQRRTQATRRTPRPLGAAVTPKESPEGNDDSKQYGLNRSWQQGWSLGVAMTKRRMGQVENRRPAFGTCVHDLEHRLQKLIEVHHGPGVADEVKRLVALVPPAMHRTARQRNGLSGASGDPASIDHGRERAGSDAAFFILREVNMQRGTFAVRRERRIQFHPDLVASGNASKLHPLARVSILHNQVPTEAFSQRTLQS